MVTAGALLPMQVGPVLRRAARLVRRLGPEPSLMPPDLEEALDAQLAGSDGPADSDSGGDDRDAEGAEADVDGRSDPEVPDSSGDDGANEDSEDDDLDPAAARWASV